MDLFEIPKTEIKKKFDVKLYQQTYQKEYQKTHKEIWSTKKLCSICNSQFMTGNLTNHNRSKKHKYNVLLDAYNKLKLQKT
jgi:hypothetical protein